MITHEEFLIAQNTCEQYVKQLTSIINITQKYSACHYHLDTKIRDVTELKRNSYKMTRAINALLCHDIETLGDLIKAPSSSVLRFRNMGKKSLNELKEKLKTIGINWD